METEFAFEACLCCIELTQFKEMVHCVEAGVGGDGEIEVVGEYRALVENVIKFPPSVQAVKSSIVWHPTLSVEQKAIILVAKYITNECVMTLCFV